MKKVDLSIDELNMLQAYREAQAKMKATANASGNNGSNHDLGTSVADKPRRKYMMQLVYRVIKKARQLFAKQLKKDTQAKIECLEAALASCQDLYPDLLRFELDFRAEREPIMWFSRVRVPSRRFSKKACRCWAKMSTCLTSRSGRTPSPCTPLRAR